MTDITTIGEVLIDLTQSGVTEQGIPRYDANPGGAPANLAVAASRLGAKTAFIGRVGDDSFGAYLRRTLERILVFANKAAAITTSRHGAIPAMPTLAEVKN